MSSDTIDRILRYGAGVEFAQLYRAVGRLRHGAPLWRFNSNDARIARVFECYDACEDTLGVFEAEIEKFKADPSDGQPTTKKGDLACPDTRKVDESKAKT